MYDHKPVFQWTFKTTTQEKRATIKADSQKAVGLFRESSPDQKRGLLTGVEMHCHVGEGRRCFGISTAHENSSHMFVVIPRSLRIIGGHDLLENNPQRNVPIPGIFRNLHDADNAARAWHTAFNENNF